MRIETVVVGMDWSPASLTAWSEARSLARLFGARLVLVHALGDGVPPLGVDPVRQRAEAMLEDLRLSPDLPEGAAPSVVVAPGRIEDVILDVARDTGASLVVIGAGPKTALERVLLGSTAEHIVRAAQVPVWLAHPGRPHADVRRVLVALDDGAPAAAALGAAVFLCRTFVAPLDVVSVTADPAARLLASPVADDEALRVAARAAGEEALKARLAKVDQHGVTVHPHVKLGKPAVGIIDAVYETRADLLVIGTTGRAGFDHLWHGCTAERVLRATPASVLVIKATSPGMA